MKVWQLIEILQKVDQTLDVITARDAEGNGYNQLNGIDTESFISVEDEGSYSIEDTYCDEDLEQYGEKSDFVRVAVIW